MAKVWFGLAVASAWACGLLEAVICCIAYLGVIASVTKLATGDLGDLTAWICLVYFGLLSSGETFGTIYPLELALKNTWPNLITIFTKMLWLGIVALLLYGLFIEGSLADGKYYLVFLSISILLLVTSIPSLIWRGVLCSKKVRDHFQSIEQKIVSSANETAQ